MAEEDEQEGATIEKGEETEDVVNKIRKEEEAEEEMVEEVLFSWFGKQVEGCIIQPIVRDQNEISVHSCAHHSLAAVVEVRSWWKWLQESVEFYKERASYSIDVETLFRRYSELRDPALIIDKLCDDKNGVFDVKESFSESDKDRFGVLFVVLRQTFFVDMRDMNDEEKLPVILKMADVVIGRKKDADKGPIVGGFYVSTNYRPDENSVYIYDDQPVMVWEDGKKEIVKHLVSIMGAMVTRLEGGELHPFLEYIETVSPFKTLKKTGLLFVHWSTLQYVAIPNVAI